MLRKKVKKEEWIKVMFLSGVVILDNFMRYLDGRRLGFN